jgi:hypothetical protein
LDTVTSPVCRNVCPSKIYLKRATDGGSSGYLNTPFDTLARTVEVCRIESRYGKYNIPNVGIFLWRIGSHSITNAPAYMVPDIGDPSIDGRRHLFDALGKDTSLYNNPVSEDQITHLAEPINVPMPLSGPVLERYLDTY